MSIKGSSRVATQKGDNIYEGISLTEGQAITLIANQVLEHIYIYMCTGAVNWNGADLLKLVSPFPYKSLN